MNVNRALEKKWSQVLPGNVLTELLNPNILTVIDGDILKPDVGMTAREVGILKKEVDIIIHTASSINLGRSFGRVANSVIDGSEKLARLALECEKLKRFVYVSTAYANSYLYNETDSPDVEVDERFYSLATKQQPNRDVVEEWMDIKTKGTSAEYETHDFPWPYAYAKHFTERLLYKMFCDAGHPEKIMILRPSIVCAAQKYPYPGFSIPLSTPSLMIAAGIALAPSVNIRMSTRLVNPETQSTFDDVPVDVVVDRLLDHLVKGSSTIVHAVGGKRSRYTFEVYWRQALQIRRIPWTPKLIWTRLSWHSPEIHPIPRIFKVIGTSFNFSEKETERLWDELSDDEKHGLQLFTAINGEQYDLLSRRDQILSTAGWVAKKNGLFARFLYFACYGRSGRYKQQIPVTYDVRGTPGPEYLHEKDMV